MGISAMAVPLARLLAVTARRSVELVVQGFEFFDDAVHECEELRPGGMRVLGDEPGGMFGEQFLAGHARPPTYFPVRDESEATKIIGATGVVQAPEYVFEVQSEKLLCLRAHVAVQHERCTFRPADSPKPQLCACPGRCAGVAQRLGVTAAPPGAPSRRSRP